jgi:hypothetical protein
MPNSVKKTKQSLCFQLVAGFPVMSTDVQRLRAQLEQSEQQVQNMYRAIAKATDELSQLFNSIRINNYAHDEEYLASVKVCHVRVVQRIAKQLSTALGSHGHQHF